MAFKSDSVAKGLLSKVNGAFSPLKKPYETLENTVLFINRTTPTETWRDAVARVGTYHGIAWELLRLYDQLVQTGLEPKEAAKRVATDWSIVANVS